MAACELWIRSVGGASRTPLGLTKSAGGGVLVFNQKGHRVFLLSLKKKEYINTDADLSI